MEAYLNYSTMKGSLLQKINSNQVVPADGDIGSLLDEITVNPEECDIERVNQQIFEHRQWSNIIRQISKWYSSI